MVADKDGNQLNEVEMLCDSLMNNNGILRDSTVIKLIPDRSAVKLRIGDPINLTADAVRTAPRRVLRRAGTQISVDLCTSFGRSVDIRRAQAGGPAAQGRLARPTAPG
jgi:hypothetical protein